MVNSKEVKIEIPSSAEFVTVARKAVEAIASRIPLSAEQIDSLKLAVGEACSNAVKFSGPGQPPVHVLYRLEPDRLEIEVRNTGKPFDPETYCPAKPSADRLPDGGLGLYLIDQVMDELDVSSKSGETILRMVKRFKR